MSLAERLRRKPVPSEPEFSRVVLTARAAVRHDPKYMLPDGELAAFDRDAASGLRWVKVRSRSARGLPRARPPRRLELWHQRSADSRLALMIYPAARVPRANGWNR